MPASRYLPHEIPPKWRELLLLIPGYDSIATAGDAFFDADAAQLALDFFPACIRHVEGKVAGKPFTLEPWQQAIVANLFGWKRKNADGEIVRRYRELFVYCARKNGKTPLIAAIALLVFFTDKEKGQQGSIAAADKKQAAKLFRHCRGMIEREPELKSRCKIFGGSSLAGQAQSIVREEDDSYLEIISADATGKHGGNPHLVIIDELHEQPNAELVEVLESSFVSANRLEPLFICITTADYDRPSICNRKYEWAVKVATGSMAIAGGKKPEEVIHDPQFLPVLYEVPRDADWKDEKNWHLANPNLGVSVDLHALRVKCKKAQEVPAEENSFRRLHLNQKTSTADKLIDLHQWDANVTPIDLPALIGRECHGALDIGATSDFCAFVRLFPHDDAETIEVPVDRGELSIQVQGDAPLAPDQSPPSDAAPLTRTIVRRSYTALLTFWLPEEPVKRDHRMQAVIDGWRRAGLIKTTPGNVVDYDVVLEDIIKLLDPYQLLDIAFDRGFQGGQMGTNLMKTYGDKVFSFPQGILSMAAPFREMLELLPVKRLHHDGHPVMRWMVSNVVAERRGGLIKPSKEKSTEKIDGVTALVMAIGRALFAVANQPRSVYDDRGVTTL
jgi:phage terminase large subunit-like protein